MEEFEENQNYEIIREKMKERPVNRKKLMKRTMITLSMAILFGVFACLTFLVLEPVFSNLLYPGPDPELVEFPEDTEELLPEDMMIAKEELNEDETVVTSKKTDDEYIEEYTALMKKMYELTKNIKKSMVDVTSVSQDIDWFNNSYESKDHGQGIVIANKNGDLYILVRADVVEAAESISVGFYEGSVARGNYLNCDQDTGLAVITVGVEELTNQLLDEIEIARLGSSRPSALLATPVIALGNPLGKADSISYGMITSKGTLVNLTDCNYELITTDIYGSTDATGFLYNFEGEMIAIINQNYNSEETKNLISAIGISELKPLIEKLSNGGEKAYLGILGVDVTAEANEMLNVPKGAYVKEIAMDSPAMNAGIQSGDIVTKMGETVIESFSQYADTLATYKPGETIIIEIMRQRKKEYQKMTLNIILD